MKFRTNLILLLFFPVFADAQHLPDSLRIAFEQAANDSVKFNVSRPIYTFYEEINRDSALYYAEYRYAIAKKNNRTIEIAYTQGQIAYQQIYLGRFSEALSNLTEAIQIAEQSKNSNTWELTPFPTIGKIKEVTLSMLNHMYGHLKLQTGSTECIHYFKEGRRIGLEVGNHFRITVADMVLATTYLQLNQLDSALIYAKEGEHYGIQGNIIKYLANIWYSMGGIYIKKGLDSLALSYYKRSLDYAIAEGNLTVVGGIYVNLFAYYQSKNKADSALAYAIKTISVVKSLGAVTTFASTEINLGNAYKNLAIAYTLQGNKDSTNKYLQLALDTKDSLTTSKLKRLADFQRLTLDEQLRFQNEEKLRTAAENRRKIYILIAGITVVLIIALLIYRNNRQKQKAYNLLQQQKAETDRQKEKAGTALQELKATQSQLIQSEKMASLGELTAGIAHEIQNPLNFVNNFSEVSKELLDEMSEELAKGNTQLAIEIANDVKQNLEKINHHGKRADGIVKGMLQHSRSSSGQKELTDINALCDEYLRLAYHGLRAKDKSFNAKFETSFDETIGKVSVMPQDIGRVVLNLINNAFYAVSERLQQAQPDKHYEPTVSVSSKKVNGKVEVRVVDNGNGIPKKIIDKIFHPFFTTKPTGQGTGLGLSLSYDIIKAHGGELNVETKEGAGTSFIIQIPTNQAEE